MSQEYQRFLDVVAALRAPDGCPWDRKQTHESLKPFLVEETYEALHAIDSGDDKELCAELGDVLLQVALHAQIASEDGRFDMEDVLKGISDKLIRRHPHVFGNVEVDGVEDVLTNWETIKASEKPDAGDASILDSVTPSLPSLKLAMQVSRKAAKAGFEWADIHGVFDKLREEILELEEAVRDDRVEDIESEVGDLLFTVVNIARWSEVDAEEALRVMVSRFRARFQAMEDRARKDGRDLKSLSADEWDDLWNQAKAARQ